MDGRGRDFGGRFGSSKGLLIILLILLFLGGLRIFKIVERLREGTIRRMKRGGVTWEGFTKSEKFFVFHFSSYSRLSIFQRRFTYSKSIPLCILPNSQTSNTFFYPTPRNVGYVT